MAGMRISQHSSAARSRRRLAAGAVAGTLLLAACGGGSDDNASDASAGQALPEASADGAEASAEPVVPAAAGAAFVDLVGPDVLPASDFEGNLLPSVVVDDLVNDRKVNFRNLVPQEKPILLWMWAPH